MRRAENALDRAHASTALDQANAATSANPDEQHPPRQQRVFADLADSLSALREKPRQ